MASVVTKGGSFRKAISTPETRPQAAPPRSVAAIDRPGPYSAISIADSTLPSAATEPTERSMPRVRMTKSMPIAIRLVPEIWRSTLMMLRSVRKTSDIDAATITSATRMATVP